MFLKDIKEDKWQYRCNTCSDETEKRDNHDTSAGLEGWHIESYADVHICPPCQAAGKTPE